VRAQLRAPSQSLWPPLSLSRTCLRRRAANADAGQARPAQSSSLGGGPIPKPPNPFTAQLAAGWTVRRGSRSDWIPGASARTAGRNAEQPLNKHRSKSWYSGQRWSRICPVPRSKIGTTRCSWIAAWETSKRTVAGSTPAGGAAPLPGAPPCRGRHADVTDASVSHPAAPHAGRHPAAIAARTLRQIESSLFVRLSSSSFRGDALRWRRRARWPRCRRRSLGSGPGVAGPKSRCLGV
jgi:hypothetical protein